MSHIYRSLHSFSTLHINDKHFVINELEKMGKNINRIGWSTHRTRYVIPLCKNITGLVLNSDEQLLLEEAKIRMYNNNVTHNDVDVLIMLWYMTKDQNYLERIRELAVTGSDIVKEITSIILAQY